MKRLSIVVFALVLVASLILAGCSSPTPTPPPSVSAPATKPATTPSQAASPSAAAKPAAKLPEKITYSCHAVGTVVHSIVTALAKVASDYSGMLVVVQPTSGPSAWLPQMNETGKPEFGSVHSLDAWWAWTGKVSPVPIPGNMLGDKPFYPGYPKLRIIATPARQGTAMLVRQDSGIKSYADFKKKKYKVASGYLGQPSAFACLVANLLNQGMTLDDFTQVTVANTNEGIKALKEGRVDCCDAALAYSVVEEANASVPMRYLSASDKPEDIQRTLNMFPGSTYTLWQTTPAALAIVEPTIALTYPVMTATTTECPDAIITATLGAWWDHYQELWKLHPAFERITSADKLMLTQPSVPYHDAAIAFYKSKGLWTSEMENYQQRLLKGESPFVKQ